MVVLTDLAVSSPVRLASSNIKRYNTQKPRCARVSIRLARFSSLCCTTFAAFHVHLCIRKKPTVMHLERLLPQKTIQALVPFKPRYPILLDIFARCPSHCISNHTDTPREAKRSGIRPIPYLPPTSAYCDVELVACRDMRPSA